MHKSPMDKESQVCGTTIGLRGGMSEVSTEWLDVADDLGHWEK